MITGQNPSSSFTADSIEDALKFFQQTVERHPDESLLYRGHADESWKVIPSIFRQVPDVSKYEADIVRELVSLFPNDFVNDQSMFDRLVRMQHYGLFTRLLDVTKNPLVALYFAVDPDEASDKDGGVIIFVGKPERHKFYDSDVVSCMANLANLKEEERSVLESTKARTISDFNALQPTDRLVQFIKGEKPYFSPRIQRVDLFRPVSVTPKRSNQRMHAQSGQFILYGLDPDHGPNYEKTNTMIKMTISKNAKFQIRNRLDQLGIDGSTMFPEIDKAAKRICQRYKDMAVPF